MQRSLVGVGADVAACVLDNERAEVTLAGVAHRALETYARADATEDEVLDAHVAQLRLDVGLDERAVTRLRELEVARGDLELVDQVGVPRAVLARADRA